MRSSTFLSTESNGREFQKADMTKMINSVTVLGAGTMGAQIALHCANAGIPALLLDLTADVARQGLEKARKLKPDPQFTPDVYKLVTTGGFDTHLDLIANSDWIMEAVVERLDIKQQLLAKVDAKRRPGSIVSSNTSGIPIAAIAEGRSDDFRANWLGTHFFNPPRYLRLLEIIPTPETDPAVVATMVKFGDHILGKGVVVARDTPNFIGNHIGLYGVARTLDALATGKYTIEEIDAITGPALGRPGSATFRTMDIAGIDVLAHVMRNLNERLTGESDRAAFAAPPIVDALIQRGALGEKTGKGFYERRKSPAGETEIWTLDPATLEYRERQSPRIASIEAGKSIDDLPERIRMLFNARDKAGEFLRATLAPTLVYTARVTPAIANSIDDVDRVMRWGFGWDLGPFELIDVIGVKDVLAAAEGSHAMEGGVPALMASLLEGGLARFREGMVKPASTDLQILRTAKEQNRVIKKNSGASLVDLGDGVIAVEFHSKMNAIGGDTVAMLQAGVKEAAKSGQALVIGSDAPNFSAGANLMLVLIEAQEGNWDEIDLMVRTFQQATMSLKYSPVPVVAAPAGLALGGGTEIPLHCDRVQAAAETYMGLVEVGVGLIPAGGGTKEMIARAMAQLPTPQSDPVPYIQKAFETIAMAKVSASGPDARRLGLLAPTDSFTMNRERLMADAKAKALERVREGYHMPATPAGIPVGGESVTALINLGIHLMWRGERISEHDRLIGQKLAHIFGGGSIPHATMVSEQYLLDLEREAFMSLLGERKTLDRIQHTLKTGKPLRN
jgi:3-hydroxyacyl-CoA dehydrogenase